MTAFQSDPMTARSSDECAFGAVKSAEETASQEIAW